MIYIIGLDHEAQFRRRVGCMTYAQAKLCERLHSITRENRTAFIAEEASEETMEGRPLDCSIPEEVAKERGINHIFCDPNEEERCKIGYKNEASILHQLNGRSLIERDDISEQEMKTKAQAIEVGCYFPIRESFWLDRLGELTGRDGIFVCGYGHVESFGQLLQDKGIDSTESDRKIGMKTENVARVKAVERYWQEHPELAGWRKPRTPASAT